MKAKTLAARRAAALIIHYRKQHGLVGKDRETVTVDLLIDLLHYCDRQGYDFASLEERAREHYLAELSEE